MTIDRSTYLSDRYSTGSPRPTSPERHRLTGQIHSPRPMYSSSPPPNRMRSPTDLSPKQTFKYYHDDISNNDRKDFIHLRSDGDGEGWHRGHTPTELQVYTPGYPPPILESVPSSEQIIDQLQRQITTLQEAIYKAEEKSRSDAEDDLAVRTARTEGKIKTMEERYESILDQLEDLRGDIKQNAESIESLQDGLASHRFRTVIDLGKVRRDLRQLDQSLEKGCDICKSYKTVRDSDYVSVNRHGRSRPANIRDYPSGRSVKFIDEFSESPRTESGTAAEIIRLLEQLTDQESVEVHRQLRDYLFQNSGKQGDPATFQGSHIQRQRPIKLNEAYASHPRRSGTDRSSNVTMENRASDGYTKFHRVSWRPETNKLVRLGAFRYLDSEGRDDDSSTDEWEDLDADIRKATAETYSQSSAMNEESETRVGAKGSLRPYTQGSDVEWVEYDIPSGRGGSRPSRTSTVTRVY